MLSERGVEVIEYVRDNNEIDGYGLVKKAMLYFTTTWSKEAEREIRELCRKYKPDVAHFHNTLPLISPSAYYACKEERVTIVQTLHNYRFLCPGALLLREGGICEECIEGDFRPALRHRCYRASYIQTRAVVRMLKKHRQMGTYEKMIDLYIALTEFVRTKFIEGGIPPEKIVVKPNFLRNPPDPKYGGDYAVYVGRLSPEKGVDVLLNAWKKIKRFQLKVVGDGPQRAQLESMRVENVEFVGAVPQEDVYSFILGARFVLFPSVWYETFGTVMIEAFACGKPVVASNLGSMAEIVKDKETGFLFTAGDPDDLAARVKLLIDDPTLAIELGRNARAEFDAKYTAEKSYERLMGIYASVIREKETV